MGLSAVECSTSYGSRTESDCVIRRFDVAAEAAAAGWNERLTLPPFLHTEWLAAFAPQGRGGAGGPPTELVQVLDARGRVRAQCLYQRLPVAGMRLGDGVRTGYLARALGDEAHQIGQALFSGPAHASQLPPSATTDLLAWVQEALATPGTWFLKDIPEAAPTPWHCIEALPEMVMPVDPVWRTFEDYLAALPSKYRRRARRARRKLGSLEMRVLDAETVGGFGESLQELYDGLMARTSYAPFVVEPGYVPRLKKLRPGDVTVLGYFDGTHMVGFATLLTDGGEGLAHLAAIDSRYNPTHQLYLNLLFDLLAIAIDRGCRRLNYGRTATTIKSSVGARPVTHASAVRHTGCVRNGLLRRMIPLVVDPANLTQPVQAPLGEIPEAGHGGGADA